MKKIMLALASIALAAGMFTGCAGTPQEKSADLLVEMQLKKTNYIKKDHIPAGIGIGISKDEQIAMEKADQNARVDLAKEIDIQLKALSKNFKEEVSGDIAEHFQSASKAIVDTRLNGATLTDVKVETTEDGQFKIYGIMTLDASLVEEYLKSLQDTDAATEEMKNKIRTAANKAYAEIDAETR
ncbi:hypothetical protein [uncultured Fibrobacter sp.]|uniref:hypothetical protein n=1 Tax=uncultured Fibrobacter sp. TaxID=261512 RepID=UPI0026252BD9|nr:hypothetical protein [uncultured Fibrobacter sp.]